MVENIKKFTNALFHDDTPKGPTSKEILEALNEIEGLDDNIELESFDILTTDACKFESLLVLPMERRKKWLWKQLKK
jgi:hypothetical protein